MIRQLAERGGVTGINFCPSFLRAEEPAAKRHRRWIWYAI